jgi:hypothetical protein
MRMSQVEKGVRFTVKIDGKEYTGTILDSAFSSEGDYLQCKCELEINNPLTGQTIKSVYPKPIQSYKLRRIGGQKAPRRYSQTPEMSDAELINNINAILEN